jgi:hypothetical protein
MFLSGRALNGFDQSDDATLDFDVIPYRGSPVATFDGWRADATARGGTITQVPGGFFANFKAARFGSTVPYVYELPPVWLLALDGVDVADQEVLSWFDYQGIATDADNQLQALHDLLTTAPGKLGDVVTSIPSILKWSAVGLIALVVLSALPRRR